MIASFEMILRQAMLYSVPLLITVSSIQLLEHYLFSRANQQAVCISLSYRGIWLPFLASIFLGRAMIIVLLQPSQWGVGAALVRIIGHLFLAVMGWLLYTWALSHPPQEGLPPLHHWWAKVLMYLNLCLLTLHLLPLPHLLVGECLLSTKTLQPYASWLRASHLFLLIPISLMVVTPMMDMLLGTYVVFPVYEQLASWAE